MKRQFATASVYGLKERKAIYREGLGAMLVDADFDETTPYDVPKRTKIISELAFPYGIRNLKTLFSVQLIMLN
jgi:hypothetical protein